MVMNFLNLCFPNIFISLSHLRRIFVDIEFKVVFFFFLAIPKIFHFTLH